MTLDFNNVTTYSVIDGEVMNEKDKNQIRREKYSENPELQIGYSKKYNEDHKDEISEYKKDYYTENSDVLKVQNNDYKEKNKEQIRQKDKEYRNKIKADNEKLGSIGIYTKTPIKHCKGCDKDIKTDGGFFIDMTMKDGLRRLCKICYGKK